MLLKLLRNLTIGSGAVFTVVSPAVAQTITSDGTTGSLVAGDPIFTIEGGSRPNNGPNLFHSFSEFSVPIGSAAIFKNAPDIERIFSRVTGSSLSSLDGFIQTQGNADLFLLNPNGILFGPNAFLAVGGSFVGTTATSIQFADNIELSTENVTSSPLLSVSVPTGLQMGQNPAAITYQSNYFESTSKETFALIGGNLSFQGASRFASLYSPDGHIELGSIASSETVLLAPSTLGWAFDYSDVANFGNISLDRSFVEVSGDGGGSIALQGNQIALTGGARAYMLTFGAVSGGELTVQARDSLLLSGEDPTVGSSSGLFSETYFGASGDGGNISINTPSLRLLDGGIILLSSGGQGNSGDLDINSDNKAENIEISGLSDIGVPSAVVSFNYGSSEGLGGNITLNTQNFILANSGRIVASTSSDSAGGNLTIHAGTIQGQGSDEFVSFGQSLIGAFTTASGDAGTANITTENLTLTGNAQIFASTTGTGAGGNLILSATDILFDRDGYSGFFSTGLNTATLGEGNAGNVDIRTDRLTLLNGAQIFGGANGSGNGGEIQIRAEETTISGAGIDQSPNGFTRSSITAESNPGSEGDAGSIDLQTNTLVIREGGSVTNAVGGEGAGGQVKIRSSEIVLSDFAEISATVRFISKGTGGQIDIVSDRISVQANTTISSSTAGIGDAGAIRIRANEQIEISGDNSRIESEVFSTGIGQGGLVDIQTPQLSITNGGKISTATNGEGNAGDISIQADQLSLLANAEISSESFNDRDAGTINLSGGSARLQDRSAVNASTSAGNGGDLNLAFSEAVLLRDVSQLTARAGGTGNGGNIAIDVPAIIGANNSDIIASAERGNGGNIAISTQGIFGLELREQLTPENDITASSDFGVNGTVEIRNLTVNPSASLIKLPTALADADNQVVAACADSHGNQFIASGRGGIPHSPLSQLSNNRSWIDFRAIDIEDMNETRMPEQTSSFNAEAPRSSGFSSIELSSHQLAEATNWNRNSDGKVVLSTGGTTDSLEIATATCSTLRS